MKKIFKNTCACCGDHYEGSPSFAFQGPIQYDPNRKDVPQNLSDDLCVIGDNYFIRAVFEVPIIGMEDPFLWGVWVSQSKENFQYYVDHFDDDLLGRETFGWFSNQLPYYADTVNLKCIVFFQGKGDRPKVHVQESKNELSSDFHNGISIEKARKIVHSATQKDQNRA